MLLHLDDVKRARERIRGTAVQTPLRLSQGLTDRRGGTVLIKMETMQHTGAFKLRGAANAFLALPPLARGRGVVTYSTGNHGRALAYVARQHGAACTVCLSTLVPANKRARLAATGAALVVEGADQDAAMAKAEALSATRGMRLIGPIDDPDVIAGQGTMALEILDDLPEVGTLVVPLSGGGLFSGIATAIRGSGRSTHLVAVSSDRCAAMRDSLAAGHPVLVAERPSLADSLGGGIGLDNRYTFEIVGRTVDEHVTVTDAAVADAMRFAFVEERLVLEGAGAASIAALLSPAATAWPTPIVVLATGDNVDPDVFRTIVLQPEAGVPSQGR